MGWARTNWDQPRKTRSLLTTGETTSFISNRNKMGNKCDLSFLSKTQYLLKMSGNTV